MSVRVAEEGAGLRAGEEEWQVDRKRAEKR